MVEGKIFITGGTGSLGTALLERIEKEKWPCDVVVFSRGEDKQSQIKRRFPQHHYILGDVAKYRDIHRAMHDVDVVFHFAAYKQVPSAQNNVFSTIETNVIGSQNIVDAAIANNVKQVVASSTDKSCAAVNAYGHSKALMEAIFQNGNQFDQTTFHLARYGNVICSNASVIPLWKRQKEAGDPITVTHKDMTRFWITLDRALDLILLALDSPPGTIVVPRAPALSIMKLAELVAEGAEIKEIGIRPGEKIHEAMVSESESFHTDHCGDYFLIYPPTDEFRSSEFFRPFAYTSDMAEEVSEKQMLQWIEDYGR